MACSTRLAESEEVGEGNPWTVESNTRIERDWKKEERIFK
jgi:hypothetical protein